jgi:hypothetical protein
MEEIYNKVKELKLKALGVVEQKLQYDIATDDLKLLTECINNISEDKNLYSNALVKMLGDNKGFSGFNGKSKETETKNEEK